MSNAERRAVIFDLDGTLIDSHRDIAHAVNAGLRAGGLPERSVAEIKGFIGQGARHLIEQAIAPHPDHFDRVFAAWERAYAANLLETTTLYPGLDPVLRAAAARFPGKLAVHTNKPGPFARAIVRGLHLEQTFARVLGSGDGPARKPDPEGALRLLDSLEVPPEHVVYVGDTRFDVQTAHAAGLAFIGVAWGFGGSDELAQAGAHTIARDAAALRRLLWD